MSDVYEIYAIRYGHHDRKAAENFIGGDDHDTDMPLDYFVWAIVGAERTYVLDTGFDPDVATRRGRKTLLPIAEGLKAVGVDAATVTDVVISHMHYDHAGNVPLFPSATCAASSAGATASIPASAAPWPSWKPTPCSAP